MTCKAIILSVGTAAAFSPGLAPMRMTAPTPVARASDVEMMPKFLKDLFPDMEKPDDPLGAIMSFFGMKDEEPTKAPEEPAPEEPAPETEEDEA